MLLFTRRLLPLITPYQLLPFLLTPPIPYHLPPRILPLLTICRPFTRTIYHQLLLTLTHYRFLPSVTVPCLLAVPYHLPPLPPTIPYHLPFPTTYHPLPAPLPPTIPYHLPFPTTYHPLPPTIPYQRPYHLPSLTTYHSLPPTIPYHLPFPTTYHPLPAPLPPTIPYHLPSLAIYHLLPLTATHCPFTTYYPLPPFTLQCYHPLPLLFPHHLYSQHFLATTITTPLTSSSTAAFNSEKGTVRS